MNELLQYAGGYGILLAALCVAKRPLRKHIEHLRAQVTQKGGRDDWGLRCECCHRQVKDSPHTVEVATYESGRTGVRVWHSDKPKCSVAFATDKDVMTVFVGKGEWK